jgi:hypothetical protein
MLNFEMDSYTGTKTVLAMPMSRAEYNTYRGWELPSDEDGSDAGMLVEDTDGGKANHPLHSGYISWSPTGVFERSYKPSGSMTFGMAISAARLGHKVSRAGWNGSGMFAYIVPAAKYKAQTSVIMDMAFENGLIPYREYWALFTAQKDVATWAPSGSDSLAEDWCIVD